MSEDYIPTSPDLPADSGIVSSEKAFSDALTQDLNDDQIKQALSLILPIKEKWQKRFIGKITHDPKFNYDQAMDMVGEFQTELSHTLAEKASILVSVDVTPLLEGRPMVIEYQGVISGHSLSQHGFDHEKKAWEVKKASERSEEYLGQHGTADSTAAKKRDKGNRGR